MPAAGSTGHTKLGILKDTSLGGEKVPAAGSTGHANLRILKNAFFAGERAPAAGSTGHTKLGIFKNASFAGEKKRLRQDPQATQSSEILDSVTGVGPEGPG